MAKSVKTETRTLAVMPPVVTMSRTDSESNRIQRPAEKGAKQQTIALGRPGEREVPIMRVAQWGNTTRPIANGRWLDNQRLNNNLARSKSDKHLTG